MSTLLENKNHFVISSKSIILMCALYKNTCI